MTLIVGHGELHTKILFDLQNEMMSFQGRGKVVCEEQWQTETIIQARNLIPRALIL